MKERWSSPASSEVGWWHLEQLPFFQDFPKELGRLQSTAPVDGEPVASMAIVVDDLGETRVVVCPGRFRSFLESPGQSRMPRELLSALWWEGGPWEQQ